MTQIKPFPEIKDIHVISIALPEISNLISSNMYIVGNGPITLIDTTFKVQSSMETVREHLDRAGFGFKDIERIIITHGHIDHFGLASQISQAAGHFVECYCHEADVWRVSSDYFNADVWNTEAQWFADMAGMPLKTVERTKRRLAFFKNYGDPLDRVIPMKDGDIFEGPGYTLSVIHTPGHSPGSCCLYEREKKVLFSGDHIIKHITPNPFFEIYRSRLRDPGYQSLKAYCESLDKLEDLDVRYVFPGHGEYLDGLGAIIAQYRDHHEERMDEILEAISQRPRHLYDLAGDIFPGASEDETFLAISEVLVHLEILINRGRAEVAAPGPPALYRAKR